jgi:hypothetical protein
MVTIIAHSEDAVEKRLSAAFPSAWIIRDCRKERTGQVATCIANGRLLMAAEDLATY